MELRVRLEKPGPPMHTPCVGHTGGETTKRILSWYDISKSEVQSGKLCTLAVAVDDEEVTDDVAAPRLLILRVGEVLLCSNGVSSSKEVDLRRSSLEPFGASTLPTLSVLILKIRCTVHFWESARVARAIGARQLDKHSSASNTGLIIIKEKPCTYARTSSQIISVGWPVKYSIDYLSTRQFERSGRWGTLEPLP